MRENGAFLCSVQNECSFFLILERRLGLCGKMYITRCNENINVCGIACRFDETFPSCPDCSCLLLDESASCSCGKRICEGCLIECAGCENFVEACSDCKTDAACADCGNVYCDECLQFAFTKCDICKNLRCVTCKNCLSGQCVHCSVNVCSWCVPEMETCTSCLDVICNICTVDHNKASCDLCGSVSCGSCIEEQPHVTCFSCNKDFCERCIVECPDCESKICKDCSEIILDHYCKGCMQPYCEACLSGCECGECSHRGYCRTCSVDIRRYAKDLILHATTLGAQNPNTAMMEVLAKICGVAEAWLADDDANHGSALFDLLCKIMINCDNETLGRLLQDASMVSKLKRFWPVLSSQLDYTPPIFARV